MSACHSVEQTQSQIRADPFKIADHTKVTVERQDILQANAAWTCAQFYGRPARAHKGSRECIPGHLSSAQRAILSTQTTGLRLWV